MILDSVPFNDYIFTGPDTQNVIYVLVFVVFDSFIIINKAVCVVSASGSGSYDLYGYKDSMSSGFGGGGYGSNERMKRGLSGGSLLSSGATADAVIAKINQRLDMLTQLEGGMKSGARGDR